MTVTQLTLNTYLKIQVFWDAGISAASSYWRFIHSANDNHLSADVAQDPKI
jgi:hypothetical protein